MLQTWRLRGKVYMAAYGGGELVEYDPRAPARFPENPRVVADPPGGMRPVAAADDGRYLFYASSREYGRLGSVLTRYDTRSGAAAYGADPLPDQQVCSLGYDAATRSLIAGSTMHADCRSCAPASDTCWFARLGPADFSVIEKAPAPAGTQAARVLGPVRRGQWLCACDGIPGGTPWFVLDARALAVPPADALARLPTDAGRILYAGRPGWFILQFGRRVELWHWPEARCAHVLSRTFTGYRVEADGESVYLVKPREITVLDGILKVLCDSGRMKAAAGPASPFVRPRRASGKPA